MLVLADQLLFTKCHPSPRPPLATLLPSAFDSKRTICCWHQAGGHSFDCFEPDFKNKFACLCLILEANSYSFIDWGRIAGAHPLTSAAAKLFTANWILIHLIRFNLNKQPNFSPRLNSSTRKPNISQLCLFPKLYWSLTLFMKLNKSNCCPSLFWLFMVSSTFSKPAQMSKHHRFTIYINSSGLHLSTSIEDCPISMISSPCHDLSNYI